MSDEEYTGNRQPRKRNYSSDRQRSEQYSTRSRSATSNRQTRIRQSGQREYSERKVQQPAADRAARQSTGTRRSTSSRAGSSTRSARSDERLSQYTRQTPSLEPEQQSERGYAADGRRSSRSRTTSSGGDSARRPSAQRRREQNNVLRPYVQEQESIPQRILGVFAAIGTAIVNFFGWIGQLIPPLRRFSAPVVTAMGVALVAVVIGVGVAAGHVSSPQPEGSESSESAESAESQQTEPAPNAVNPNEPADLVWRDTDFAVDPSFHNWSNKDNGHKTVFLTVDDGPSRLTEQYLDLFDKYGVKATFFVTGQNPEYYYLIQEAYNRGHTIGLHSMSHDYNQIYSSEEAFYKDLDQIGQVVKEQIGYVPCFIRFPGGSSNTRAEELSKGLMPKLVNGVQARGYQFYDWSLASGDGEDRSTAEIIAISTESDGTEPDPTKDTNIVYLCHDSATKQTTLEALPKVIEHYQAAGYTFEALDRSTWMCHHALYMPEEESTDENADENADENTGEGEFEEGYEEYYDEGTEEA